MAKLFQRIQYKARNVRNGAPSGGSGRAHLGWKADLKAGVADVASGPNYPASFIGFPIDRSKGRHRGNAVASILPEPGPAYAFIG